MMLQGIRQHAIVGDQGTITIAAPDLPAGAHVEVIVLVELAGEDDTSYLLADEANRAHLQRALRDLDDPEKYIYVDINAL